MKNIDFIEVWWRSVARIIDNGVTVAKFVRSRSDIVNESCSISIICGSKEMDIVIWDSGEAEISRMNSSGEISQDHFDNIFNVDSLSMVLSSVIDISAR